MEKSSSPDASFQQPPDSPDAQTLNGGADAVQGTTYTVGKGTDDRAQRSPEAADPMADREETDTNPQPRAGTDEQDA